MLYCCRVWISPRFRSRPRPRNDGQPVRQLPQVPARVPRGGRGGGVRRGPLPPPGPGAQWRPAAVPPVAPLHHHPHPHPLATLPASPQTAPARARAVPPDARSHPPAPVRLVLRGPHVASQPQGAQQVLEGHLPRARLGRPQLPLLAERADLARAHLRAPALRGGPLPSGRRARPGAAHAAVRLRGEAGGALRGGDARARRGRARARPRVGRLHRRAALPRAGAQAAAARPQLPGAPGPPGREPRRASRRSARFAASTAPAPTGPAHLPAGLPAGVPLHLLTLG